MDVQNSQQDQHQPEQPQQQSPQQNTPEPAGQWQYNPNSSGQAFGDESADAAAPSSAGTEETVEWTASEFVAHERTGGWYGSFVGITLVAIALVYIITRDIVSVIVIAVLAVIIAFGASRQPKVMSYRLDRSGLSVGPKKYPYKLFKAFSVAEEGAFASITFAPLNRFMPPLSIYFSPEDEEKIIQVLSSRLPLQPPSQDFFDSIMKHARF